MAVSWPLLSCIALEKGLSHSDAGKYRPSQYVNMYGSSTGNIQQEGWPGVFDFRGNDFQGSS